MRSHPLRSTYFFLESIIVILFFTVSAAICVSVSAQASIKSDRAEAKRFALIASENVLEKMKTENILETDHTILSISQTQYCTTWQDQKDRTYLVTFTIEEQKGSYYGGNMQVVYHDDILFTLPFVSKGETI